MLVAVVGKSDRKGSKYQKLGETAKNTRNVACYLSQCNEMSCNVMSSKVKVKGKRLIKNSAMFGNIWGWNANLPGEVRSAFAQIMFPLNTNFLLPLVNPETVRLQTG